jgi:hypothetical protein
MMSEAIRTMMRMDAETAHEAAAQADEGFLWDFWYPAMRRTEIRGEARDGSAARTPRPDLGGHRKIS